jgi:hypothetical protein
MNQTLVEIATIFFNRLLKELTEKTIVAAPTVVEEEGK